MFPVQFPCREHRVASSLEKNYNFYVAGIRIHYATFLLGRSKENDVTTFGCRKAGFGEKTRKPSNDLLLMTFVGGRVCIVVMTTISRHEFAISTSMSSLLQQ